MNKLSVSILLAVVFFAACNNDKPVAPAAPPLTWNGAMKMKEKICLSPKDTNRCAAVNIDVPLAQGGDNAAVTTAINDSIKKYVIAGVDFGEGPASTDVEKAAKSFLDSYETASKDSPSEMSWEAEVKGNALFTSSKVTSVELTNYMGTGGAHPNHSTVLLCFDRKTGKTLGAKDLFTDQAAVSKMLEKPFFDLKKADSPELKSLADLLFPDVKFGLPQNIAVVKEGVRFYYNPYELTAYAYGDFDLLLTWEQLGALAKKEAFLD